MGERLLFIGCIMLVLNILIDLVRFDIRPDYDLPMKKRLDIKSKQDKVFSVIFTIYNIIVMAVIIAGVILK